MVSIANMNNHPGAIVQVNDQRRVELSPELAAAIATLDQRLKSGSKVEKSEVRTLVTDLARAVFVRLGADRIGQALDGVLGPS